MANIEDEFRKMRLAGKSAVELTSSEVSATPRSKSEAEVDVYYLQLHQYTGTHDDPKTDGNLAVLCSTHNVRIFDSERLVRTSTIDGSSAQVTKVRFGHNSPDLVYTSSVDSQIRCWDLRTDLLKPVSSFTASDCKGAAFLSFDMTCNDRFMCAGTKLKKEDAVLYFWDHRQPESIGCYEDLHSDDITQVRFHPTRQDSLLTASDDGLVNYLDISQSEDDAIQYTLDTSSTPDKLAWLNSDEVFVSTFCNSAFIWDTNSGDEKVKKSLIDFQDKIKTNKVSYLVDCFVDSNDSPTILAGNDECDGLMFTLTESPSYLGYLPSAHSAWIRACSYNRKSQSLYTVGEDALLCAWKPSHLLKTSPSKHTSSSAKSSHRRKSAAERKPYNKK